MPSAIASPPCPADLGEQLGDRLGDDDVAPERRQRTARRAPCRSSTRWRRRRPPPPARTPPGVVQLRRRGCASPACPRTRATPAASAARRSARTSTSGLRPSRRRGRSTPRAEDRRAQRSATSSRESATTSSGCPTAAAAATARGRSPRPAREGGADTISIPASRRRTSAACRSANARTPGTIASAARASRTASVVAQHGPRRRERRPVPVEKAAVAAARPRAADIGLEERDQRSPGVALAQRQRGPEACISPADDCDVRGLGSPASGGRPARRFPSAASASASHHAGKTRLDATPLEA